MIVKDIFSEVFVGYNYINSPVKDKYAKIYKTLHKDSIQYTNIISSKLVEKAFSNEIKTKYFIQSQDIIVFIKKPFRVGTIRTNKPEEIIIPNNFVILRGIDSLKYHYLFVATYLEKIGIQKYVQDHHKEGNLTLEDIKDIPLPDISLEMQMTIIPLLNSINNRCAIYNDILDNDDKIINYALESVLGDYHD